MHTFINAIVDEKAKMWDLLMWFLKKLHTNNAIEIKMGNNVTAKIILTCFAKLRPQKLFYCNPNIVAGKTF